MNTTRTLRTEADLVRLVADSLRNGNSAFGDLELMAGDGEGAPAILGRDAGNRLIAFEARLRDWKRALLQAYRDTAVAHQAYIVLPMRAALHAVRYRREFEVRGIGLCVLAKSGIQILIEAVEHSPVPPLANAGCAARLPISDPLRC